jgi:hypothetical protein
VFPKLFMTCSFWNFIWMMGEGELQNLWKTCWNPCKFLETKSLESCCFLNQNTFLLEDFKSKGFWNSFLFLLKFLERLQTKSFRKNFVS